MPPKRLTLAQYEQRIRAANAKAAMARDGISLRRAAGLNHIAGQTVLRWFPDTVVRDTSGRYVALPDREAFLMVIVTVDDGPVAVWTRGSVERHRVAVYFEAVRRALHPRIRDTGMLEKLTGAKIAGHVLETDPVRLKQLYDAGELNFDDLYHLGEPAE